MYIEKLPFLTAVSILSRVLLDRGDINFEDIIRTFNHIGYSGPLSVEWEDTGMDREHGAAEACDFVKQLDFQRSEVAFDAAFEE